MKKYIISAMIAAAMVSPVRAQSASNIVVVDVASVLNGFYEAQTKQKEFQSAVDQVNATIRDNISKGVELQKQYQDTLGHANDSALTPDARQLYKTQLDAKGKDLQDLDASITKFRNDSAKMLQDQQNAIVTTEVGKIKDAVTVVAKRHNATLALNSSGIGAVVYADSAMDISKEVLDLLNSGQTPPPASAGAASGAVTPSSSSPATSSTSTRSGPPALSLPPMSPSPSGTR